MSRRERESLGDNIQPDEGMKKFNAKHPHRALEDKKGWCKKKGYTWRNKAALRLSREGK